MIKYGSKYILTLFTVGWTYYSVDCRRYTVCDSYVRRLHGLYIRQIPLRRISHHLNGIITSPSLPIAAVILLHGNDLRRYFFLIIPTPTHLSAILYGRISVILNYENNFHWNLLCYNSIQKNEQSQFWQLYILIKMLHRIYIRILELYYVIPIARVPTD